MKTIFVFVGLVLLATGLAAKHEEPRPNHLTNRRTGDSILAMQIVLMPLEKPESPLFTMSCYSNHVVLVLPDKNLLLHVTSNGFREWDESVEGGKTLNLPSGTRLTLSVQLDPAD